MCLPNDAVVSILSRYRVGLSLLTGEKLRTRKTLHKNSRQLCGEKNKNYNINSRNHPALFVKSHALFCRAYNIYTQRGVLFVFNMSVEYLCWPCFLSLLLEVSLCMKKAHMCGCYAMTQVGLNSTIGISCCVVLLVFVGPSSASTREEG